MRHPCLDVVVVFAGAGAAGATWRGASVTLDAALPYLLPLPKLPPLPWPPPPPPPTTAAAARCSNPARFRHCAGWKPRGSCPALIRTGRAADVGGGNHLQGSRQAPVASARIRQPNTMRLVGHCPTRSGVARPGLTPPNSEAQPDNPVVLTPDLAKRGLDGDPSVHPESCVLPKWHVA